MNKILFKGLFCIGLITINTYANDDIGIMDLKELAYNLMNDVERLDNNTTKRLDKCKHIFADMNKTVKANKVILQELEFLNQYTISSKFINYLNIKQNSSIK
jgi:hypothetical protein